MMQNSHFLPGGRKIRYGRYYVHTVGHWMMYNKKLIVEALDFICCAMLEFVGRGSRSKL